MDCVFFTTPCSRWEYFCLKFDSNSIKFVKEYQKFCRALRSRCAGLQVAQTWRSVCTTCVYFPFEEGRVVFYDLVTGGDGDGLFLNKGCRLLWTQWVTVDDGKGLKPGSIGLRRMLWSDSLSWTWFHTVLYIRAKVVFASRQHQTLTHVRSISIWCVVLILKGDGRWRSRNMFMLSRSSLCSLTSSDPEHEYPSAECLKCKCERFNKKRRRLCSSAVYGNAGLWLWIIHVSFQTEKFEKLTKWRVFFSL